MKKLLILLVFILGFGSASAQSNLDKGLQNYDKKDYPKAIEFFKKHLKKKPNDLTAMNYLGLAYIFVQEPDSAVFYLTRAIELNPSLSDSYNNRGFAYSYMGLLDSSLTDFNKAIELDSTSSRAYLNRGSLYSAWKTYEKAIKDYTKALEYEPGNPEAHFQRGLMYYKVRKFKESYDDLSKAQEMHIESEELLLFKANAAYRLNLYSEAINDYTGVLGINPNNIEAINNRGMSHMALGDSSAAADDWASLRKTNKLYNSIIPLDTIKYSRFVTTDSAVSIVLPSWFSIEHLDSNRSEMLISPEDITKGKTNYITGCYISLNRNMDKQYKLSTGDEIIEFWKSSNENNLKEYIYNRPIHQRTFRREGWSCINLISDIQISETSGEMRYFQHARASNGTLLFVYFQVPSVLYKYYEKIINEAINSIQIIEKKK